MSHDLNHVPNALTNDPDKIGRAIRAASIACAHSGDLQEVLGKLGRSLEELADALDDLRNEE